MQDALRVNDVVGRYGGEEFLVVTPVDCIENAGWLYQRICDAVSGQPIVVGDISLTITLSCGITNYSPTEDAQSVEKIISKADKGLYKAKEAGRNQVVSQAL